MQDGAAEPLHSGRVEGLDALTAAKTPRGNSCGPTVMPPSADQGSVAKKNLAQIILAAACNGEREPERLKEIALRGVSVRSNPQ